MRLSRILLGILLIALVAWGIFWLNDNGYFTRDNVDNRGAQHSDQPPPVTPKMESTASPSPEPDTSNAGASTNVSTDPDADYAKTRKQAEETYRKEEQDEARGSLPVGTAKADYVSTMQKAEADRDLAKKLAAGQPAPAANTGVVATVTNPTPAQSATTQANVQQWPNGWPKGAVADANGSPCMPIKPKAAVAVRPRSRRAWSPPATTYAYTRGTVIGRSCSYFQSSGGLHQVELPAGLLINASVDRTLSTSGSMDGDTFTATLVGPITYCGRVVVPAGSVMQGTVDIARRHPVFSPGNSLLELRVNNLQANGFSIPLHGGSVTEQNRDDLPLRSVTYDNGGREYTSVQHTGRDVTFPANSVVSFWLQSPTTVSF